MVLDRTMFYSYLTTTWLDQAQQKISLGYHKCIHNKDNTKKGKERKGKGIWSSESLLGCNTCIQQVILILQNANCHSNSINSADQERTWENGELKGKKKVFFSFFVFHNIKTRHRYNKVRGSPLKHLFRIMHRVGHAIARQAKAIITFTCILWAFYVRHKINCYSLHGNVFELEEGN